MSGDESLNSEANYGLTNDGLMPKQELVEENIVLVVNDHDLDTEGTSFKMSWTYPATKFFISAMSQYKEDLDNSKKRQRIFKKVCTELQRNGYMYSNYSVRNKWKSLMRVYKANKSRMSLTGQSSFRFSFYEEMDELMNAISTRKRNSVRISCDDVNQDQQDEEEEQQEVVDDEMIDALHPKIKCRKSNDKEAGKERRHRELMRMEMRKLKLEARKIELLEKICNSLI